MAEGKNISKKWEKYAIDNGVLVRKNPFCPICGPGIFLALHADRTTCGNCGHVEPTAAQAAPEKD